jgi:Ser/Thr protein kinase RdoA (MazF antagonist)
MALAACKDACACLEGPGPRQHTAGLFNRPVRRMTFADNNPLAIIASELPRFSSQLAVDLMQSKYGMQIQRAKSLVSERDQNFQLQSADGRKLVLKIANAAEDPQVTDFQIKALQHIEDYQLQFGERFKAPRIVPTLDGQSQIAIEDESMSCIARVVSYVEGVPLGDDEPSAGLCRNTGAYLAELGRALKDFQHAGSDQNLLWDMKRALRLRELLCHIRPSSLADRVSRCLDDFEERVLPRFASLRWQVIHNDLNPDNILLDVAGGSRVVGVIDFGDMLAAPLIVDLAVASSYMRLGEGDPLDGIAACLSGYHSVTPLFPEETDLLFDLVRTRLAATISIRHWRISEKSPDDPYLQKILQENTAEEMLARLDELPRESVQRTFRQVCASQDVAAKA